MLQRVFRQPLVTAAQRKQTAGSAKPARSALAARFYATEKRKYTKRSTKAEVSAPTRATASSAGSTGLSSRFISKAAEQALNDHINAEYNAHYIYLSFANYFARADVALHGFAKYFAAQSAEEQAHAKQMIDYLLQRGGTVRLQAIAAPPEDLSSPLYVFEKSMQMEEDIYDKLINLHKLAAELADPNLSDFLEATFLTEQVAALKSVSDQVTNLKRISSSELGVYLFDKQLAGTLNPADALAGKA